MGRLAGAAVIVLFATCILTAIVAWGASVFYLVRIPFNAKPDAFSTWWLRLNPLNIILMPNRLTDSGRVMRRRLGKALLAFVASVILGAMFGSIAMRL
jgi:uncharacterized membrane protein